MGLDSREPTELEFYPEEGEFDRHESLRRENKSLLCLTGLSCVKEIPRNV
jgi:hypothetical protein